MFNKIIFTNGSGEPINDENLNYMQLQYTEGVEEAKRIKGSSSYAACIRYNVYNETQALDGEIYLLDNPLGEYNPNDDELDDEFLDDELGGE